MDELQSLQFRCAGLLALAALSACSEERVEPAYADQLDPIVAQALSDQLMVDPDLVGQNEANAALISAPDGSVPTEIATQAAIRAAREAAGVILAKRGGPVALPEPQSLAQVGEEAPLELLSSQVARLASAAECLDTASYSAGWAARMPAELPIYPRSATVSALGSDEDGCALRAVRLHTPVPLDEVSAFYFAIATAGEFAPSYRASNGQHRIEGTSGDRELAVQIRSSLEGLTQIDIVTAIK